MLSSHRSLRCLAVALLAAATASASAADPSPPALHRVTRVPFRVEARIEGVFEAPVSAEVRLDAKRASQFSVEKAVPHGTRVGKGDVLVEVDTEALDEEIADQTLAGQLADIAHELLEKELAIIEKATPLWLEMARTTRRRLTEDLGRYEEKEKALAKDLNDVILEFNEFNRENAEEELGQLEKMYKQDDLTEETEEIVLKRARFEARIARFIATMARDRHERMATLDLPRELDALRKSSDFSALDLEQAEGRLPLALARQRLSVEKSAADRREAARKLAEAKALRRLLPVTAPIDGTVYYGRFHQGRWVDADNAAQQLRPGGQFDTRQPLLTVIGPGRLAVRAGVPEKELSRVPEAAEARIVPKAFPEAAHPARVRSVSAVPVSAGRFEALVDLLEDQPRLVAGMEAEVRVTADQRSDVLAVPRKAVFTDDFDGGRRYVLVFTGAGKEPMKRMVSVGRSNDELTELTAGLSVGEEILLEKPAPAKPETAAAKPEAAPAKPEPVAPKPEPAKPEAAATPAPEGAAASPPKDAPDKPAPGQK
ncbi:MAG: HlyD family efflux transporter periplasmic adaptor subunit [Planctomycetia bacterium]|jgi:HlyD family secretion protein